MARTIPILPCQSMPENLAFWQSLDYEVTYQQKAPYAYGVVHSNDIDFHFIGVDIEPVHNFSSCLVLVSELETLHRTYATKIKSFKEKSPYQGVPRISRMREGQTRFTLTDVAGNSIIFIIQGGKDHEVAEAYKSTDQTPLQRSLNMARRLRDFKNDDAAAAKVLDVAIKKHGDDTSIEFAQILSARIELGIILNDSNYAQELYSQLRNLPISKRDLEQLARASFEEFAANLNE
ncbi:MAG: hypothetical protein R3C19_21825 [Planctomycetaceae bacterium]